MWIRRHGASSYLILCLVLGGASAAGVVANAVLQLTAIGLIGAIIVPGTLPVASSLRTLLLLVAAFAGILMLQLVPLPYPIWSILPGRAAVTDAFVLAGAGTPWLPISLTPDATIAALLSLLPALAMILAVMNASPAGQRDALVALLGFALLSVLLGGLQRAGGDESLLYAYAFTNRGSAVGLFANRNHLGTLMLCTLPFVAALANERPRMAARMAAGAVALVIAAGAILTGSRAAIGLLAPVLAGSAAMMLHGNRVVRANIWPGLVAGVGILTAAAIVLLAHGGGGGEDPARSQHRAVIGETTLRAAVDSLPIGSGGGSFAAVYPAYEDTAAVTPEYTNHAHDDYAEMLLELGIPGAVLVMAAWIAWCMRVVAIWGVAGADADRARAGAVALAAILAHSLVDYPLRTAAIAAVAGLAAALLASPIAAGTAASPIRIRRGAPA